MSDSLKIKQPHKNDVIVSAGHKNFHMLFTASEMQKRGRLSQVICGAYPTIFEQKLLNTWPFSLSRKLNRFANRLEKLPADSIHQSRKSEILSSFSGLLSKLGFNRDELNVKAFHIYGKTSEKVLRRAVKEGAKIYHYRAGFGQSSVALAKQLGMKTICDHSIVHPSLLNVLIENKGVFPDKLPDKPEGIWRAVLDDIESADLVVVNSDFVAETFKFMGFDESKLTVVYQGVEDKFFNCLPKTRDFYDKDCTRPIRFLFAGGIVPRKGIDELSEVMAELKSDQVELHLAGSLPEDSRIRYTKLLQDPRVTYHGMLSQKEIAQLMSDSDVFLFPSRAEGSARVIFEAMASGCAVICTPNSGSVIQDGVGGRLIPPNNNKELAKAIQDVLHEPEKYAVFGKTNKKTIENDFTQSAYGKAIEKSYLQLTNSIKV